MGLQFRRFKAIQIASRILPRPAMYRISDRIADSFFARNDRAREAVTGNIRRILAYRGTHPPAGEVKEMARRVFRGLGRNFADFFRFTRLSPASARRLLDMEGLGHLDHSYRLGKGVIILSGHYGCFEMGACAVISLGYPLSLVARPWEEKRADALFDHQRRRRGVNVIHVGSAARESLAALRRGEMLAILGDFDYTLRDDRMRFLDGDVRLPLGPARLSVKTGAPILPCFVTRLPDGRFSVRFHPPIIPGPATSVGEVQGRIVRVLEEAVLAQPDAWLLFNDVWDCEMSLEIARKGFVLFSTKEQAQESGAR